MTKVLTQQEKQYLRKVSNYLGSLGMKDGDIEFEMEHYEGSIDYDNIDWRYLTHFSNNYRAEIPPGLYPILEKIMKYASDNELFSSKAVDADEITWQKFEITINRVENTISLFHYWTYYGTEDGSFMNYDDVDDDGFFTDWIDSGIFNETEIPGDGILTVNYSGGGDDGYLENQFYENGSQVPAEIEDWCYDQLASNFGGWEINEGSFGKFIFDFKNKTVELEHTYNTEVNESDTLWEENFGINE